MKKVSFVIPTLDREEYLAAAIDSCLEQSYKNIEVVVVNDGSTDGTDELMKYYVENNDNVVYIELDRNVGIAAARNIGVESASGDYIAVMDSDDVNAPDRIKNQVRTIKDRDFAYSPYGVATPDGNIQGMVKAPSKFTAEDIKENKSIPHVTIMAKRKCFVDNPYREELKANDDKGLLIDWFKAGYKGVRLQDPTVVVRMHDTNVSRLKNDYIQQINKELDNELS